MRTKQINTKNKANVESFTKAPSVRPSTSLGKALNKTDKSAAVFEASAGTSPAVVAKGIDQPRTYVATVATPIPSTPSAPKKPVSDTNVAPKATTVDINDIPVAIATPQAVGGYVAQEPDTKTPSIRRRWLLLAVLVALYLYIKNKKK